jgi:hypothetical protein
MRHRVAGVDGQVDDRLLELADIDPGQLSVSSGDSTTWMFADQALQQLSTSASSALRPRPGPQHLLAAEGQQLAREVGGTLARAANLRISCDWDRWVEAVEASPKLMIAVNRLRVGRRRRPCLTASIFCVAGTAARALQLACRPRKTRPMTSFCASR